MDKCDVAIVGGGVIGSAIAYFLAANPGFRGSVAVIEKDPTYETAATPRSAGGIRQQFSTPENIEMSAFGARFVKSSGEYLSVDGEAAQLPFVEWGYLFLATPAGLEVLQRNHRQQAALGASVALLASGDLRERFPWLNVEDLAGGCYGLANEGWPEGANYIGGISPEEAEDPDCTDFEIDYRLYEDVVWPTLAHRIPAFEAIKLVRAWAGHYDYNTLDQNAILGPHPEIRNFYFANGFSGHGLQQSPAVGRATAEHIIHGGYRSIDLSRFGYERVLRNEPIFELNVV